MLYYRRKILLNLLRQCGGSLEKLKLQKLLLIFCSHQVKPAYQFVPYKFGCFSFQANADLGTMQKMGLVEGSDTTWTLGKGAEPQEPIRPEDAGNLTLVCDAYANLSTAQLIKHTYVSFPFYALNSTIVQNVLNEEQLLNVAGTVVRDESQGLFTIGYEGKSLEEFLNKLLRTNVKVLCDVRKNAYSMKYGFSKSTLANACDNVGIKYRHIPSLGIESSERKELGSQADYNALFDRYEATVLPRTRTEQESVLASVESDKRVALMCFEATPSMCHRSHLAGSILGLRTTNLPLVHL